MKNLLYTLFVLFIGNFSFAQDVNDVLGKYHSKLYESIILLDNNEKFYDQGIISYTSDNFIKTVQGRNEYQLGRIKKIKNGQALGERLNNYADAIKTKKWNKLYELISDQNKNGIPKDIFLQNYQNIKIHVDDFYLLGFQDHTSHQAGKQVVQVMLLMKCDDKNLSSKFKGYIFGIDTWIFDGKQWQVVSSAFPFLIISKSPFTLQ